MSEFFVTMPERDEFAGIPLAFMGLGASKKTLKKRLAAQVAAVARQKKVVARQKKVVARQRATIAELQQVAQTLVEQGMSVQQAAQTAVAYQQPAYQAPDPYAYQPQYAQQPAYQPWYQPQPAYQPEYQPQQYQYQAGPTFSAPTTLLPSDMPLYADEQQPFSVPSQITDLQADPFSSAASWGGGFFAAGHRPGRFIRSRFMNRVPSRRGGGPGFMATRF